MAKKKPYNKTSNYGIYYSQSREKSELIPIGKVRSNFVGTEFLIYDNGKNHKEALVPVEERKVLAGIVYEKNIFGSKGPRKMRLIRPDPLNATDF